MYSLTKRQARIMDFNVNAMISHWGISIGEGQVLKINSVLPFKAITWAAVWIMDLRGTAVEAGRSGEKAGDSWGQRWQRLRLRKKSCRQGWGIQKKTLKAEWQWMRCVCWKRRIKDDSKFCGGQFLDKQMEEREATLNSKIMVRLCDVWEGW